MCIYRSLPKKNMRMHKMTSYKNDTTLMSRNILKHRCGKNQVFTRSRATRRTWSQHPLQVGFGHTAATRCFERPLWTSEMEGFDGLDWLGQKFIVISQLYMWGIGKMKAHENGIGSEALLVVFRPRFAVLMILSIIISHQKQKWSMEFCCGLSPSKCTNPWCTTHCLLPAYLLPICSCGHGAARSCKSKL